MIRYPEDCNSMTEVRAGVDEVDERLVALLAHRFGYMVAAARIKDDRELVRDEARKAQVIANVRQHARQAGVPELLVAEVWDMLVESSISYEMKLFDRKAKASA